MLMFIHSIGFDDCCRLKFKTVGGTIIIVCFHRQILGIAYIVCKCLLALTFNTF